MAAFDPATIQAQRELLDQTTRDVARDRRLLDKQPKGSKSKMAQTLRDRIAEGERIAHDLRGLIPFMEGLNAEQPDAMPEPAAGAAFYGMGHDGGAL